ncbi:MAG: methylenetetrahydrofolate reductase C-terminal domain-containing protein [Solirubrobacteraceae bacterium]
MATLREKLNAPGAFVVGSELVTSRGVLEQHSGQALVELAHQLAENPRIDFLSLTDNPGGNPMIAPDMLANRMREVGQEVVLHIACKDMNRNGIESRAWKAASAGLDNILALSGDYPIAGQSGTAAPVFDIDSVGLLHLLSDMNQGVEETRAPDGRLLGTRFFLGCVVTNHKLHEREVMPQYFKLEKKAQAGAEFVINQLGWNARKDDELLRWVGQRELPVKMIANVYLLTRGVVRVFHAGRIPGCVVTDELLAQAEKYGGGEDKGREFFVDLAAKQVAVARGLGYQGAYIGGHMPIGTYDEILDAATAIGERWPEVAKDLHYDRPGEFYLYGRDAATGLSDGQPREQYLESKRRRRTDLKVPVRYKVSRVMHNAVFAQDAPLFPLGTRVYEKLDKGPKSLRRAAHLAEQAAKVPMFDCKDCGDCSLPDIAYVCPEGPCAKNQRNGPCGGTRDGLCEVYDTECIWAQAYERLKAYGEEEDLVKGPVVIKNNALRGASAWANTFLGRDHNAHNADPSHPSTRQPPEKDH